MNILSVAKGFTSVVNGKTAGAAAKFIFKAKKYAPAAAVITGAAGTVAAGIWAVQKTATKAPEVMEEVAKDVAKAKEEHSVKALTGAYVRSAVKVGKLYAGPILLETVSVCGILWGYRVINGRFVAMTATAAALEDANERLRADHAGYREALKEKFGENFDEGIKWKGNGLAIGGKTPVDENGEEGSWALQEPISVEGGISPYAVIFDELSTEWSNDPEYNKWTLHRIQQTCNDRLHADKYLFLNDVYKELGLPCTRIGQMVGWLDDGTGDGYVDFGMYNVKAVNNRSEFINGYEPSILLDFNVDGVIWDKI